MRKNEDTFLPERFYHVYNRTSNKEKLFTQQRNYFYFLKQYNKYLSPVLTTYAYCLLGNHFHLLVKIRSEEILLDFIKASGDMDYHKIVSRQFATFFGGYTKAFNKQEDRYGSLFQRPFKRVEISNEVKFANIIYYIHANPELHGITKDFKKYKWSSYQTFLSDKPSNIPREEVIEWFGGMDYYLDYHKECHEGKTGSWKIE